MHLHSFHCCVYFSFHFFALLYILYYLLASKSISCSVRGRLADFHPQPSKQFSASSTSRYPATETISCDPEKSSFPSPLRLCLPSRRHVPPLRHPSRYPAGKSVVPVLCRRSVPHFCLPWPRVVRGGSRLGDGPGPRLELGRRRGGGGRFPLEGSREEEGRRMVRAFLPPRAPAEERWPRIVLPPRPGPLL